MTTLLDHFPHGGTPNFEDTEHTRLNLLNSIDQTQLQPDGIMRRIRAKYLSRRALKLAQRKEVYLPQKEDLIKRAVVLNPGLEDKAHKTLDKLYDSEHPELSNAGFEGLPAAKDVAHLALEKTVELSLDLHDSDDTPTAPIPVAEILATSLGIVNEEQTSHLPPSKIAEEIAQRHESRYHEVALQHESQLQKDQKAERIKNASEADLSEVDDAVAMDPSDLFDDDEDERAA